MRLHRKQKLFITLLIFLIVFVAIIFLYQSNRTKNLNVILIMIDSLRPDHLGCYGYQRNTSPYIDTFAKNSSLYVNAFSQSSWTIPSVYSLLTSLYPSQHKMDSWSSLVNHDIPTLISLLHDNGYSVGVFGNQDLFFRNLKENYGSLLNELKKNPSASFVTNDALQWIRSQNRPFFLWVYYVNPHRPYNPPPPHDNLYSFDSAHHLPIRNVDEDYIEGWDYIPRIIVDHDIDNPDYYITQYDGEIHYVDEEIGKLLNGLKEKGLFHNSLIILTSDHGESLVEHHLYFNHIYTLFNEVIKVSLIIKYPGQSSDRIIQANVALIDVFPTIAKELSIKMLKGIEGISLQGIGQKKREILASNSRMVALISRNWKLIYDGDSQRYELYNLKRDPQELNNLVDIEKDQFAFLKQKLDDFMKQAKRHKITRFFLSEETKEMLRSLGYMQ